MPRQKEKLSSTHILCVEVTINAKTPYVQKGALGIAANRQKSKLREKGWSNNLLLRRSDGKTTTCVAIYVDDVPPAAGGRMLVPIYQMCQKGALGIAAQRQQTKNRGTISTTKMVVEVTINAKTPYVQKRSVPAIYVDDVPQWISEIEENRIPLARKLDGQLDRRDRDSTMLCIFEAQLDHQDDDRGHGRPRPGLVAAARGGRPPGRGHPRQNSKPRRRPDSGESGGSPLTHPPIGGGVFVRGERHP